MKHKGLTLIELLAVIVILGIIASIAFFTIGNTIDESKVKVDTYNLNTLNLITNRYATEHTASVIDIFEGINSDEDRMSELVYYGYLSSPVEAQQDSASFQWDIDNQIWIIDGGETDQTVLADPISYDFSIDEYDTLLDDGFISDNPNSWSTNQDALETSSYTTLFVPINQIEYTITVSASISSGDYGGYGVFFETILIDDDPDRDTGYILQFDRGYSRGAFIVRRREDGKELSPVWDIRWDESSLFPSKNDDPDWWTDTHIISIEVSLVNDTTKEAKFYVDGGLLGSYIFDIDAPGEAIYTGFRSWATTSSFYSLNVE